MTAKSTGRSVKRLTAVKRVSPAQQIREQLLAAIEAGEYPPGSPLPSERELCETFGVSRVSVREALAGLEAMNLIVVKQGRGAFVQESINERYAGPFAVYLKMHRDELIELAKVRGALESMAAEEAARSDDKDALRAIEDAAKDFEKAAEAGDRSAIAERDRDFHTRIADASAGTLLPQLLHELSLVLAEGRAATFAEDGQAQKSVREHRAMVRAIVNQDPLAARRAAAKHFTRISDWLAGLPEQNQR